MYTDSHAHITSPQIVAEADQVLLRAHAKGVTRVVNICTDIISLEQGLMLAQKYSWVYNAAATTPHDVEKEGEEFFPIVKKHALKGDLVAIGETGLDYHYTHSPVRLQKDFLLRYFALALETKLPLIFHCRDAFADLFMLADQHYKTVPALLHCFTGSVDEAKGVFDRGWYLSLSGIVTFKKSEALREVAKMAPLDRLLIETDTPYLAPHSQRGKMNEPAFILETAAAIAAVKGISVEEVAKATSANAETFFSFSKRRSIV